MIILTNNTRSNSIVGKLVSIDPSNPSSFIYTTPNSSRATGVVTQAVPYRQKCKIATIGDTAKVLVQGNVIKDNVIRASKSGDNVSLGSCKIAKASDAPYLKVGTALESGNGLISTVLELTFAGDDSGIGYVPYTGATDDVDLGTHSITSGGGRFGSATNYVDIDASGEMTFNGDATVWDDFRILPSNFDRPGITDPSIQDWQPGGSGMTFKVWCFNQLQMGYFTVQIPHSYKQGSNILVHTHWTPHARGVAENGKTVAWKLDYSWANIDGTFGASANADMTDTCDGVDHKHLMTPEATILGANKTISSMLVCRIYRDNTDDWVGTGANGPALLELDFHFEIDTVGSKTHSAK